MGKRLWNTIGLHLRRDAGLELLAKMSENYSTVLKKMYSKTIHFSPGVELFQQQLAKNIIGAQLRILKDPF